MPALDYILNQKLNQLDDKNLLRQLNISNREGAVHLSHGNKKLISFSCNNYLGLTHHPQILQSAERALRQYGAGGGASRLVSGNYHLYDELEQKLAMYKSTESACVFGSGYLANIGTIPALVGKGDLVIIDRLAHACLLDGARLSGAKYIRFKHNDMSHLAELLIKNRDKYQHCLILTDTIFSMDGDIAPINELSSLAKKYNSWLMTDDAHGTSPSSIQPKADIQMGTLSKAMGSYGGYVCGSKTLINYLHNKARSLIYTTALPPAIIATASAAIDVMMGDTSLCQEPLQNAQIFCDILGLPTATSQIVPIYCGTEKNALEASKWLRECGFLVVAIRPPTVPKGTSRLRFSFSAAHSKNEIIELAKYVRRCPFIYSTYSNFE